MSATSLLLRQMRPSWSIEASRKEVRRQRNKDACRRGSPYRPGSVVTMNAGRQYKVQDDGSLRVINKPRSRVARLREERLKSPPV